jgi:hypothetical protein
MKTYRHPETGHKTRVADDDAAAIASLEAQGYVEWGATEVKQRIADAAKAVEDAKAKLKAAQEEVAAGHPAIEPLNPNAKVTTDADDEIASVTVETKQPGPGGAPATDVTTVPKPLNAPAVPKRPS